MKTKPWEQDSFKFFIKLEQEKNSSDLGKW